MPKVVFDHNETDEIEYLQNLEQERDWFVENDFPAVLPDENTKPAESYQQNRTVIEQRLPEVEDSWSQLADNFFAALAKTINLPNQTYECHLSFFGPEGKYHRPNYLFVRANPTDTVSSILETIAHELIHLAVANDATQQNLDYAAKEKLVDDIMTSPELKKIFPNYRSQQ